MVGQMRENQHSIYITDGDGEYCKNKDQLSKEELKQFITGDCYNGMIKWNHRLSSVKDLTIPVKRHISKSLASIRFS